MSNHEIQTMINDQYRDVNPRDGRYPAKFAVVEVTKAGARIVSWHKGRSIADKRCVPANPSAFVGLMNCRVFEAE